MTEETDIPEEGENSNSPESQPEKTPPTTPPQAPSEFAKEVLPITLEAEMKKSYLDYAMSVIVGRALPDVRDGLKPVHRRVLYAMKELGNDYNKSYKKSARIVGDVIGKYHPHGDTAVYDTMVRMAQPFSMRHMLIDGQGNFGSVDGDSPASTKRLLISYLSMMNLSGSLRCCRLVFLVY